MNFCIFIWNYSGFMGVITPPPINLHIYRVGQIPGLVVFLFVTYFVHDILEISHTAGARRLRWFMWVYVIILSPLYFTPLIIKEVYFNPHDANYFVQIAGPLYFIHLPFMGAILLVLAAQSWRGFKRSSGLKRSQIKLMILALCFGALGTFFTFLQFVSWDLPQVYFSLEIICSFCFAYAIFKYRLFDFNLWMKRVTSFALIYLGIMVLPFTLTHSFHGTFQEFISRNWWALPLALVGYGIIFSVAPLLYIFVRDKAEQKRLSYLNAQIEVLQNTTKQLANLRDLTLDKITQQILAVFKKFYVEDTPSPISTMIFYVFLDTDRFSITSYPPRKGNVDGLKELTATIKTLSSPRWTRPFTRRDLENHFSESPPPGILFPSLLQSENIEIICPCTAEGTLTGFLLLGPKHNSLFWPEEINILQATASHVAGAVRQFELAERTQQLRELDSLKKELISNITHEFKSPLSVVYNAVHTILKNLKEDDPKTQSIREYLDMIQNNAGRLAVFIENLLEISKIEQANIQLDFAAGELWTVIHEAVDLQKTLAEDKGLKLILQEGDPIYLPLDVQKMQQVITNLVSNAIKFTDTGEIRIWTEEAEGVVRIIVEDTGRGIDPAYVPNIFDRFFKIPDKKGTSLKGTGLGLTIAKGWVEAHGGRIQAESPGLGKGTRFIIELPLEAA